MNQQTQDHINYSLLLKNNYRKGCHRLRDTLNCPTTGMEFCTNIGGVSVVFGVTSVDADKNSRELFEIMGANQKWIDIALSTWLKDFTTFNDIDEVVTDVERFKEVLAVPQAFLPIPWSHALWAKISSNAEMMELLAASEHGMAAVVSCTNGACTVLAASSTAMTAVAASSTAMTAVAASSTAMSKCAAAAAARTAIEASSVAISALAKSPLAKTVKDKPIVNANQNGTVAVNGNCWVINCRHSNDNAGGNNSTSYSLQIATKLQDNGVHRVGNTCADTYNKDVAVSKFIKNLTPAWFGNPGTGWNGNNFTAKYIQC